MFADEEKDERRKRRSKNKRPDLKSGKEPSSEVTQSTQTQDVLTRTQRALVAVT